LKAPAVARSGGAATRVAVMLAVAAISTLASCATPPPPPVQVPTASVRLAAGTVSVAAIDIDSVRVTAELLVANDGEVAVALGGLELRTGSGAAPVLVGVDFGGEPLAPGAVASRTVAFDLDAPPGDAPAVPLSISASVTYSSAGSGAGTAVASYDGEFPRILPPSLRIASIRILKDELINTKLRVDVEVTNPNGFPLSFAALDYRLFGEGRYWASGSIAEPFMAPARTMATASLYLTMNFTDMSRSLLDQVIKLASVNYRLEGKGRVATGLEFLPEFALPFDMAGRTQVSR